MDDYKKIFRLVKPYWPRVALAGVISLIVSGLNASMAWLVKPALDDVIQKKNSQFLLMMPVIVFSVFFLKGVFTFFHEYLMRSAGQKMVMDLRNRLFGHVMQLPLRYFDGSASGMLMSKIINDTGVIQNVVSLTVKDLFIESASVIALSSVALWRRWDLTLIALVVLPAAFYGVGRLGKRIRLISRHTQEKISLLTEFLSESLAGIKIIKAFNMQPAESSRFMKANKDYYRETMRATRVSELAALIMEMVGGIGIAFVIGYGGILVMKGTITFGDFFSFLTAIFLIYTPAKRLAKVNVGIQQARAPFDRIQQLLTEEKEAEGAEELPPLERTIEFRDVSFTYPLAERKALDAVNLTIQKGEVLAIVGQSGGGKTTLINLLPRFFDPAEGVIRIDGSDIAKATFRSLRSQFGIVSQDVVLFNDTVAANISYGKTGVSPEAIRAAAEAAYAHDFIMELPAAYETVIGERGARLSGGQRQRLSIARAILMNPPILILDEATSALDTASEMMVQKALENLMKARTTLVIAHRLSTIKMADRIIVLDRGKIVEAGSHEELYAQGGLYRKLYELQFSRQNQEEPSA